MDHKQGEYQSSYEHMDKRFGMFSIDSEKVTESAPFVQHNSAVGGAVVIDSEFMGIP